MRPTRRRADRNRACVDFSATAAATGASAIAWACALAGIAGAAWCAPWSRLRGDEQNHVFLGAIVAVAVLWSIDAAIGPLPRLHLLGATLLYLMFGLPLALVAMAAVASLATVFAPGEWLLVAPRALLGGVAPVLASHTVLRICERWLPANFFVYVFGGAFFGGAVAMLSAGAATAILLSMLVPEAVLPRDTLVPVLLMLAFGEATLTGMLATLMAVYRPGWIHSFSDERYLAHK